MFFVFDVANQEREGVFKTDEALNSCQILFRNFTFAVTNADEKIQI